MPDLHGALHSVPTPGRPVPVFPLCPRHRPEQMFQLVPAPPGSQCECCSHLCTNSLPLLQLPRLVSFLHCLLSNAFLRNFKKSFSVFQVLANQWCSQITRSAGNRTFLIIFIPNFIEGFQSSGWGWGATEWMHAYKQQSLFRPATTELICLILIFPCSYIRNRQDTFVKCFAVCVCAWACTHSHSHSSTRTEDLDCAGPVLYHWATLPPFHPRHWGKFFAFWKTAGPVNFCKYCKNLP